CAATLRPIQIGGVRAIRYLFHMTTPETQQEVPSRDGYVIRKRTPVSTRRITRPQWRRRDRIFSRHGFGGIKNNKMNKIEQHMESSCITAVNFNPAVDWRPHDPAPRLSLFLLGLLL